MLVTDVACLLQRSHRGLIGHPVAEQSDLPQLLAQKLLVRVTEQFAHEGVGVRDSPAGGIEDQDAVLGGLEQSSIARLGIDECQFDQLDVVNVGVDAHPQDNLADLVPHRNAPADVPAVFTVGPPKATFVLVHCAGLSGVQPALKVSVDVVGVDELSPAKVLDLLEREARVLHPLRIEVVDAAIRIGGDEFLGDRFQNELKPFRAVAYLRLDSQLRISHGDIAGDRLQEGQLVGVELLFCSASE